MPSIPLGGKIVHQ